MGGEGQRDWCISCWRVLGLGLVSSLSGIPEEGALSGCVSLLRTPALALAAPPVPEESQQPGCSLALLWGRQNSVSSHSKQIPRCGLPSCHVFPHEIPDLVCCVYLKAHPLPPKTSAGEGETFLVELPVFELVSDYAPPLWPRYTILSTNSLSEGRGGRVCFSPRPAPPNSCGN